MAFSIYHFKASQPLVPHHQEIILIKSIELKNTIEYKQSSQTFQAQLGTLITRSKSKTITKRNHNATYVMQTNAGKIQAKLWNLQ